MITGSSYWQSQLPLTMYVNKLLCKNWPPKGVCSWCWPCFVCQPLASAVDLAGWCLVQHYSKLIHRRLVEKEGKSINFQCLLLKWLFGSINQLCKILIAECLEWCPSAVGFLLTSQSSMYSERERIFFSCFMSNDCLARLWFLLLFFCREMWPVLSVFCLVCPGPIISGVFSTCFFKLKRKIQ